MSNYWAVIVRWEFTIALLYGLVVLLSSWTATKGSVKFGKRIRNFYYLPYALFFIALSHVVAFLVLLRPIDVVVAMLWTASWYGCMLITNHRYKGWYRYMQENHPYRLLKGWEDIP